MQSCIICPWSIILLGILSLPYFSKMNLTIGPWFRLLYHSAYHCHAFSQLLSSSTSLSSETRDFLAYSSEDWFLFLCLFFNLGTGIFLIKWRSGKITSPTPRSPESVCYFVIFKYRSKHGWFSFIENCRLHIGSLCLSISHCGNILIHPLLPNLLS